MRALAAFLVAVNPAAIAAGSDGIGGDAGHRHRGAALGRARALAAGLSEPVLDLLDVSAPTFRVAAGAVLAVAGIRWVVVGARPTVQEDASALALLPLFLAPQVVAVAITVGVDDGVATVALAGAAALFAAVDRGPLARSGVDVVVVVGAPDRCRRRRHRPGPRRRRGEDRVGVPKRVSTHVLHHVPVLSGWRRSLVILGSWLDSGPRNGPTSRIGRSRTSTPGAGGGFRSTTRPTSATRWLGSTRSTSRTTPLVTGRGIGCSTRRSGTGSCRWGSSPASWTRSAPFGERRARQPVSLPTGFLTMLMTDIEGSTGLVDRLGERYRELIGDVRTLLRETAVAFAGQAVETRADEFFAVFESPGAALDAAIAMQRELRESSWVDGVEVSVRIGIHSGYPTLDEVNYIGLAIHTTARVCDAAHGGQVIVSGDTKEASQGQRPAGLRFVSLGEHRLRGIPKAVPLFQAAAKGLPSRFPPPRTVKTR